MTVSFRFGVPVLMSTLLAALSACGGGGGAEAPTPTPVAATNTPTLSATQKNFETAALNGYWVRYDGNLPTTNDAPATGTHFLYEDRFSSPSSPSTGPKAGTQATVNAASTLALPNLTQRYVLRVLKNGVIYTNNHDSKIEWSYSGANVLTTQYATDGVTPLYVSVYDSWSPPIALTGQIANATILKSFLGFTQLTLATDNFDFTKSWLSGASYFTHKSYQKDDTLFLRDWTGTSTYDSAVTPYPGAETTIETLFAAAPVGGITVGGVLYPLSAGTITTIEGASVWVANNKRPTSTSPTDEYLTFVQLGGKIYYGGLVKAGTRVSSIDGVDPNTVNDYAIRLNSTAAISMKQAIKF